jgi:hypothetical protein
VRARGKSKTDSNLRKFSYKKVKVNILMKSHIVPVSYKTA